MSDNKGKISITGVLAIGNGEKCPFCDLINEKDLDILGHMIENHKENINNVLFGDNNE